MEWATPDAVAPGGPSRSMESRSPAGRPAAGDELPHLRPMTVSDVLDGAFAMLRRAPATILGFTALFVLPVTLVVGWLQRDITVTDPFEVFDTGDSSLLASESASDGPDVLVQVIGYLGPGIALVFVAAAMARLAGAWLVGRDLTIGELIRGSAPRAWPLLASWALVKLAEAVGLLACGLGELAVMTWFLVVAPVVGVERVGPITAMRRSARLANRQFWRVLGLGILAGIVASVFGFAVQLVPTLILWLTGIDAYGWVAVSVTGALTSIITIPVVAGAAALTYLDLRVRTEGLDLELEARRAFAITT